MFVQRLFQTSAGPVYVESDHDGMRATAFDPDGRVRGGTDLTASALEALPGFLEADLDLPEAEASRMAAEINAALDAEGDGETLSLWTLAVVMLGTIGVWLIGIAAIVGTIVYAILRVM